MSQAGSSLSLALLNAVSTSVLSLLMLMCFWDLKDLIAWENCASIFSPENQKECSARRVTTDEIVSYVLKISGFGIPAMAWNLKSPCTYNE